MKNNDPLYSNYIKVLKEELIPAMGCTEPAALAFASAKARELLGKAPEKVLVEVSGNIIKNVKSVIVPNTGGLKGIKSAVAVGIVAGNSERNLEVITFVTNEQQNLIAEFLEKIPIEIKVADTERSLEIIVTLFADKSNVRLRIIDTHTNIVSIEKNGEFIFKAEEKPEFNNETDRTMLDIQEIIDFADNVIIDDVEEFIERQITFNSAISKEGLRGNYGANIGRVLCKSFGDDIKVKARAAAAAGSDARMSGCNLPVIILSGSGNQGITASLPVIEYAEYLNKSREELIRALVLSNLITIHLKTGIGRLSAYCGVVSAGAAAGSAIAYLQGGRLKDVSHTLVNALAITSGIICDGAKPSCAAKIATAVDAGILGYEMSKNGQEFYGGDGIISKCVEKTIKNISRLGREGMRKTNTEILQIMLDEE